MNLKAFALAIMDDWPDLHVDSWDVFDIAEKHGILVPETRFKPCGDNCNCAEYYDDSDWARGQACYRINPDLRDSQ